MTSKRILITGANSYIGTSFEKYIAKYNAEHQKDCYVVDTLDMKSSLWKEYDFSRYDVVFHVVGIAHADTGNLTKEQQQLYYKVNCDLAIETAKKAKSSEVKQFIYMSSIIVYGSNPEPENNNIITGDTKPRPDNYYGDSKLLAEEGLKKLSDNNFKVAILRPPMIYGPGCKGNYRTLESIVKHISIFPKIDNVRSVLGLDNFCSIVCWIIDTSQEGIFLIQDKKNLSTSDLAEQIAKNNNKRLKTIRLFNSFITLMKKSNGKIGKLANKAFGNLAYDGNNKNILIFENYLITKIDSFKTIKNNNYSVLMSVYEKDKPDELMKSIDSMLNQTVLCNQFVLVEDGTLNRDLEEVVDNYSKEYPDLFTVVKLDKNSGLAKALDIGLKECKNELVARMDADDISKPDRCEKLLKMFSVYPSLAIAGTNIDEFFDSPENCISQRRVPSHYEDICKFIKTRSPFNHPTVMFKKSEVIKCGGYGDMRFKQDYDLFSRMINNCCYARNIDESLLLFRSNKDNYKRRHSWKYCRSYIEVCYKNYERGYCSVLDLLYVICGQLFLFLAPMSVMKIVSDLVLRKKIQKTLM